MGALALIIVAVGIFALSVGSARAQEDVVQYTVVPGDTCWGITENFGFDGHLFDEVVYYPNESAIEGNVRQYGLLNSDFCHWIHPGLRLFITPGEPVVVVGNGDGNGPNSNGTNDADPDGSNNSNGRGGFNFVYAPTTIDIDVVGDNGTDFEDDWPFWLFAVLLGILALGILGALLTGREGSGHHHHDDPPPPPPSPPAPAIIHVLPFSPFDVIDLTIILRLVLVEVEEGEDDDTTPKQEGDGPDEEATSGTEKPSS